VTGHALLGREKVIDVNGTTGRKMKSEMIDWIDQKVRKIIAEAFAEETSHEERQRMVINVGAIAVALTFVVLPILLILFYIGMRLIFG
jgi:hypothetical protein